ncbi:hypothetical protein [uncultured Draconibacterium sp.]|uniref:hypothetical protein n=1 Tax=uncultured Draconibacterium sp. TaxID=1573823 RepID=UPI0029BFDDE9|nr:hypothetical protein [uncultured Draconibacterium sp.]
MQIKTSIILCTIKPFSKADISKIYRVLKQFPYSDELGFGFKDIDINSSYLVAKLLKRTPSYLYRYDVSSNQVYKENIVHISETEFLLDCDFGTLEIISSQKDANKLRSVLRNILGSEYSINNYVFKASDIVPIMEKGHGHLIITKMKISNFQYDKNVSGTFYTVLNSNRRAIELINKYKTDINKITFEVDFEDHSKSEFSLSDFGGLTLKCEENKLDSNLQFIKTSFLNS